jgi:SAM-dependent methyltransferase
MLQRPRDCIATFEEDGSVIVRSTSRGAGAQAPAYALDVLAFCSVPRSRDEVEAALGPLGAQAYDGLAAADLLVHPDDARSTPVQLHNYSGIDVHRAMLHDDARLDAYWRALRATVRPDDVVVDAGSGTGVLAVMAALCGARKVVAIERSDFASAIPFVARDSGVDVEVVRADFGTVVLPEKATVLVTETFGHWALGEGMMPDVHGFAATNLFAGARIVPAACTLFLAPIAHLPNDVLGPFGTRRWGVDLSALRADAIGRAFDRVVLPNEIGVAQAVGTVPVPNDGTFTGSITLDAPVQGLAAWFTLHLADGVDLPTGPLDPPTHWKQTILPIALEAGTHAIEAGPAPEDSRTLLVSIGDREVRIR